MFRKISKKHLNVVPYDQGVSSYFSFMHMFDAFLLRTLDGFSLTAGYGRRYFSDSSGNTEYGSLNSLASALSEPLIAPRSINTSATASDDDCQVCLNAAWAAQRTRMLKLLRYVKVEGGGFVMRKAAAQDNAYGPTPQSAYSGIDSWSLTDVDYAGWETPLACRMEYQYNALSMPEQRWEIFSASEITQITQSFDGCLETATGELCFNATDLRQRNLNGTPYEPEGYVFLFDAMGKPVSSGANTLALSSGVFASWGYGSANIGNTGSEESRNVRGWQALNVRIVYDYESAFNFKQGE